MLKYKKYKENYHHKIIKNLLENLFSSFQRNPSKAFEKPMFVPNLFKICQYNLQHIYLNDLSHD